MLATLVENPFDDPDWLFEMKLDGVRALVIRESDDVRIMSRNQKPFGRRFPEVVEGVG